MTKGYLADGTPFSASYDSENRLTELRYTQNQQAIVENFDNLNDMTANSVNRTMAKFYNSLISKEPHNRDRAKRYLLGVTDATEGKSWCSYRTVKTVSIRDTLDEEI